MIFDRATNKLCTNEGRLIKQFDCPLQKQWGMMSKTESEVVRFCSSCQKDVVNITGFTEQQIIAIFSVTPNKCAHVDLNLSYEDIQLKGKAIDAHKCHNSNGHNFPIINTARDLPSINKAVEDGYEVIVLPTNIKSSPKQKNQLWKSADGHFYVDKPDNKAQTINLVEVCLNDTNIDEYSSHLFTSIINVGDYRFPFSAYIIPKGLPINSKVFVSDVIEHILVMEDRGDEYRLNSGVATWTGNSILMDDVACEVILG